MNMSYNEVFTNFLETKYDNEFENISDLTWLPWVGKNYEKTRILIIGESHYYSNILEAKSDKAYTREVIAEYPVHGYAANWEYGNRKNNPTFDNLFRVLTNGDSLLEKTTKERGLFCTNFAFCNIVQRPMSSNKERPTYNDFLSGWKSLFSVMSILKPAFCLFIGVTAANAYNQAISENNFKEAQPIQYGQKINRTIKRTAQIGDCKIYFMKHTSQYFKWQDWQRDLQETNDYILDKIGKI